MTLKKYILDRFPIIFAFFFVELSLFMMGYAFKVNIQFKYAMAGIILIAFVLCSIWDYARKRNYYKELFSVLEELDQKYLITDMEMKPNFLDAQLFAEVLYETDKSMKEHLNNNAKALRDFKEYVELWIHEIKVPIAALSLMNYNEDTDLVKQKREIQRVSYYVEQILFFARADAPEKDYLLKECSLDFVVNQVLKDQKELLIGNRIAISKELNDISVVTDSKWLSFMVGQVVNNCVKYMDTKKSPSITFSAKTNKDRVEFSIEDNGIGIPAQDQGRIFEKTFTGENGRRGAASTGMGLYICKKLCDKLGHKIYVESEEGKYTRIVFLFGQNTFLNSKKW